MKVYEEIAHVSVSYDKANEFTDMVATRIDEYQRIHGLHVEVQYSQSLQGFSALVLGYKESDKN